LAALTEIPFELDIEALMKSAHIEAGTEDESEFADLLNRARAAAKPKALYEESFIDAKGSETVTIDGITFTSQTLRKNLDTVERVFPFITTCGHEVDQITLPEGDFLMEFWLDTIKSVLLGFARDYLNHHLTRKYALGKTATMHPGSGDLNVWLIQQQKELFALLGDVKALIGVELTDSFLMTPNKTVSGIRYPTEVDFRSCQLCHRENCPSRIVPFDRNLWESMEYK
jgi:hypothetical protein